MIILVMGLPGSGKTTLATKLAKELLANNFNADKVRTAFNDWDFSEAGRIRQSRRMRELCDFSAAYYNICDFVAPLREQREILNPDFIIWMNTVTHGRYEDTNAAFQCPDDYDLIVHEWDYDIDSIAKMIQDKAH